MSKPLLLIDVDGPLNPFAAKPTRRPDGYDTHRLRPAGWEDRPLRVWLNPKHGAMLLGLTDVVDLVWATTWGHDANLMIGPLIGLPELPVIEVGRPSWMDGPHIFKLEPVAKYVGSRAFAWFDDAFEKADLEWARQRDAEGKPTLFLRINPAVGIVQDDVDRVAQWARSLVDRGETQ